MSKTLEISTKFSADKTGAITGLASPYGGDPDQGNDIVTAGAFSASLAGKSSIPMLWQHDPTRPIGHWHKFTETSQGLMVEGKLNLDTQAGREAMAHVDAGDIKGLSIGYMIEPKGSVVKAGGVRHINAAQLKEISVVTFPMADRAGVTSVKSFETRGELKSALRDLGLSRSAAELVTAGGWPALTKANPEIDELKKAAIAIQRATSGKA